MAAAGESSGYGGNGGGAGGKFRKRPLRKAAHATPYDRPPAPGNPSWLSKIVVEPASRLIASSAQRFFASVFRKRLPPPPPPPPPEMHQVLSNERPEAAEAEVQEAVNDGISYLERELKNKTFTRSEIDHLTELLQSRAEDGSRNSDFRSEADHDKLAANSERQQQYFSSPLAGKSMPYDLSHGRNVTPAIRTRVLEEDIASPAEIAKAYMGNQTSRISPSMLGLRTCAVREESNMLRNVPYTPKSSVTPMATKGSHGEGPGNGFVTPRSRGRSAIYRMARTPYSRVHPTAFGKGSGSRLAGFGGPLPALSVNEQLGELGSNRMALKRRSSMLDDDLGSMRRTRQKPHNTFLYQEIGSSSTARQHPLIDERVQRSSKLSGENDDLRTSRTSYDHVPPHSTKMAEKIFEHIELMASKPKAKSPAKLTTDMLRGQALKSLEDADSSKLLYNNHVHDKLDGSSPSKQKNCHVSNKEKDDTEEIVFQKNDVSTPGNGDTKTSVAGTSTNIEAYFVAKADAEHPPKKLGFTMNVHEDLDDDTSCDGPTVEVLPKVNSNQEKQNSITVEKSFPDKLPVLPDHRTPPESISGGKAEFDSSKQASNEVLGSDPVANPAGPEPWSYLLPNPDRILPGSVKGIDNSVAEAAKTNGKMDNSPSVPSSSTPSTGISFSYPITDKGAPATSPSIFSDTLASASTGITNSYLTNGTSNIASSASASSSGATTSSSGATTFSATLLSTEAAVAPKTTFNIESAGNPSISASNAEVHGPKTGKESSAETSSSLFPSTTSFATPGAGSGIFGVTKSSTAASLGKDSLSSSIGRSLPSANTSFAGSGAGSVSAMAQVQFASSAPSFVFGSSPAVASVSSNPSFSSPSLSETMQFGPGSGATPGIYSFNAKAPSSENNVISTNSNNTPFGSTASATNATDSSISASPFSSATNAIESSTPVFTSFAGNSSAGNTVSSNSASTGGFGANSFSSTGFSHGTNSAPVFGSSTSSQSASPAFGSSTFQSATPAFGSSSTSFQSSTPAFGTSSTFQSSTPAFLSSNSFQSATPAFGSSSGSFQTTNSAPAFGSSGSFQNAISAPAFGSSGSFQSTISAPAFGSSGSFQSTISAPAFGSSGSFPSISKTSGFGSSTSSTQSPFGVQPGFGGTGPSFTSSVVNNDQMQEETMAEDNVNSSMPVAPMFSQQPMPSPPGGYGFPAQSTNPFPFTGQQSQAAPQMPFVFSGQQNQAAQQNANSFQASGSLEFGAGGSFSMGSGGVGGDKSGRRNFKAKRMVKKK